MKENFVDIVGYQLEKVHTGTLAWLLDSDRSPLPIEEQVSIVQELIPNLSQDFEVASIKSIREYSFGRRLHIDLVLKLQSDSEKEAFILIECKTDSDVRIKQLEKSAKTFTAQKPKIPFSMIILALGAGQYTIQHQRDEIMGQGYTILDLQSAFRIFSDLSIIGKNRLYDDWIESLDEEIKRNANIEKALMSASCPWDDSLTQKGYRTGFPVFYIYYDKLRSFLEQGPFKDWSVYSGSNNPVMNWNNGWISVKSTDDRLQFYWEFNWSSLCLKAYVDKNKVSRWKALRPEVVNICSSCQIKGRKTANKAGTWVTAYKWDFDFCKEPAAQIAQATADILSFVHIKLQKEYQKA